MRAKRFLIMASLALAVGWVVAGKLNSLTPTESSLSSESEGPCPATDTFLAFHNIELTYEMRAGGLTSVDLARTAALAKYGGHPRTRLQAAETLEMYSQVMYADIAKHDPDWRIRREAVEKMTEARTLADIAKTERKDEVGVAAIRQLCTSANRRWTVESHLADIALNAAALHVRIAAAEKLTEQAHLVRVLKNATKHPDDWFVRYAAAERLTDPALLAETAKNDPAMHVRSVATRNPHLTDQATLADIAKTTNSITAAERVTDQELLAELVNSTLGDSAYAYLTMHALEKLDERHQDIFVKIVKWHDMDSRIYSMAVEKLADLALVAEIAKNDDRHNVHYTAMKRLREAAVEQAVFDDIAKHDKNRARRREIVQQVTDPATLASMATYDTDDIVRRTAVEKLGDRAVLADIAKNDADPAVREAAEKRLAALGGQK